MKNKIYSGLIALSINAIAQQNPTGSPSVNNINWARGGNSIAGVNPNINNIFGTMWNSPVYHYTSGRNRMTLFDNTFTGAGTSTPFGGGLGINLDPNNPITRPKSLLHIGDNGRPNDGSRTWMRVGTFCSIESDNMYVGLKNEGSGDREDAVINWGDNTVGGTAGLIV